MPAMKAIAVCWDDAKRHNVVNSYVLRSFTPVTWLSTVMHYGYDKYCFLVKPINDGEGKFTKQKSAEFFLKPGPGIWKLSDRLVCSLKLSQKIFSEAYRLILVPLE